MQEGNKIDIQLDTLIQGCIKGERASQTRLYNLFSQKMFVVCLRYAKSREEAEEILQEGFMKVFDCVNQFRFAGSFEGWMRRIMVNSALQRYRKKGLLHPVGNIDPEVADIEMHEDILSRIGTKELMKMIQLLPPAYRLTFNLFVFEGLKHREIAEMLGVSEGTSKSNLSDARTILQKSVARSLQSSQAKIN